MDDTGVRLMKATKAYIASLGTTGILLAASILMLAVVSAVVAFDRWPNGNLSTRVQTLVLDEQAAPIRVSAHAAAPSARAVVDRTRAAGARPATRANGGTRTGVVAPVTPVVAPVSPGESAVPPLSVQPVTSPQPTQPVQDAATPIIDTISNPSTAIGRVADGVQALTDSAGVSLGRVSPQVGAAVAGPGQAAAETVRQLPLP